MPEPVYTIDIPGAGDILKMNIPNVNDKLLRRQRIQRMKSRLPPLPEALQWIPPLINKLDDAQDILITGLVLAKPLLRRLPARFVPYLGWVLAANDAINLLTMLLGVATGGSNVKKLFAQTTDVLNSHGAKYPTAVAAFLGKTNWFAFTLQAGQAMEYMTGYGLSLGAVMGTVSDTVWGLIRAAQGAEIEIRLPPPEDPLMKAARYLSQGQAWKIYPDALSPNDLKLLVAADAIAMQIAQGSGAWSTMSQRGDEAANTRMPIWLPTNNASIAALEEESATFKGISRNPGFGEQRTGTFSDLTRMLGKAEGPWQEYMRHQYQGDLNDQKAMQMLYDEAGFGFWDFQAGGGGGHGKILEPWESAGLQAAEGGVFPHPLAKEEEIAGWLLVAWTSMYASRFNHNWPWTLAMTGELVWKHTWTWPKDVSRTAPPDRKRKKRKKRVNWSWGSRLGPEFMNSPSVKEYARKMEIWRQSGR